MHLAPALDKVRSFTENILNVTLLTHVQYVQKFDSLVTSIILCLQLGQNFVL
jgi:hypothetical protein